MVIVAQVAMTVAFPATTFFVRRSVVQIQNAGCRVPVGRIPVGPARDGRRGSARHHG